MLTRTVRRGFPVVALAAAGLALTACGSNDASSASSPASSAASSSASAGTSSDGANADGSTSATGSTGSATSQTAGSSSASSSDGSTGTKAASGGGSGSTAPVCATGKLRTTATNFDTGAGTAGFQIVFTNTGSAPCALHGYPGVSFVAAHNTQLGKAASRTPGNVTYVTLIPNGSAYADVLSVNGQAGYSAAQCHLTTVPTLRVYPPNQKESTNIPWNRQECVGSTVQNLRVGPVHSNR